MPSSEGRDRSSWPDAVLVGLELNGLGLARALHRRGVRVRAVTGPGSRAMGTTRAVAQVVRLDAWQQEAVIEGLLRLGRQLDQPAILFQTKDEGVIWTSQHRDILAPYYQIALPPPATVDLLINKGLFYPLAEKEGWPLPKSWGARSEAELDAILPELSFPCILKPQVKNSLFRKQGTAKAFKPTSADELRRVYRLVAQWEPEVVISEWIQGRDDQLVSCRGYWNRQGEPVIRFVARKLLQWPIELGNMAVVEPAPRAWWEDARELTTRIFRKTGLFGPGAVEFKRRPDGRLVILEPCVGRTVYSHEVAPLNGFDIPWACFADLALGQTVPEPPIPDRGIKLVDGPRARGSARAYRAANALSASDVAAIFSGPRTDMLWRLSDPLPAVTDLFDRTVGRVARGLRKRLARGQPSDSGRPTPT